MRLTLPLIVILFLGGCVTANVDEMTFDAPIAASVMARCHFGSSART